MMKPEAIDWIKQNFESVKNDITEKISEYPDFPKILLLGDSQTGKTTLKNFFIHKKLRVIKKNYKNYSFRCSKSENDTKQNQMISIDFDSKIVFCECPPLDCEDLNESILNSLIIDEIIKNSKNKMKILLVIGEYEFDTMRGRSILQKIQRMFKMFPNTEQLEDAIALVITQGEREIEGINYLQKLAIGAPPDMKTLCDFFIEKQQVYTFPKPSERQIDHHYDFNDHDKLILFIKRKYASNPDHLVALSDKSTTEYKNILSLQNQERDKIFNKIFEKISEIYHNENSTDKLQLWQSVICQMKDIYKVKELKNFIQTNMPQIGDFDSEFQKMEEYEYVQCSLNEFLINEKQLSFIYTPLIHHIKRCCEQINQIITKILDIEHKKEVNSFLEKEQELLKQKAENAKKFIENYQKQIKENNDMNDSDNQDNKNESDISDTEIIWHKSDFSKEENYNRQNESHDQNNSDNEDQNSSDNENQNNSDNENQNNSDKENQNNSDNEDQNSSDNENQNNSDKEDQNNSDKEDQNNSDKENFEVPNGNGLCATSLKEYQNNSDNENQNNSDKEYQNNSDNENQNNSNDEDQKDNKFDCRNMKLSCLNCKNLSKQNEIEWLYASKKRLNEQKRRELQDLFDEKQRLKERISRNEDDLINESQQLMNEYGLKQKQINDRKNTLNDQQKQYEEFYADKELEINQIYENRKREIDIEIQKIIETI